MNGYGNSLICWFVLKLCWIALLFCSLYRAILIIMFLLDKSFYCSSILVNHQNRFEYIQFFSNLNANLIFPIKLKNGDLMNAKMSFNFYLFSFVLLVLLVRKWMDMEICWFVGSFWFFVESVLKSIFNYHFILIMSLVIRFINRMAHRLLASC